MVDIHRRRRKRYLYDYRTRSGLLAFPSLGFTSNLGGVHLSACCMISSNGSNPSDLRSTYWIAMPVFVPTFELFL